MRLIGPDQCGRRNLDRLHCNHGYFGVTDVRPDTAFLYYPSSFGRRYYEEESRSDNKGGNMSTVD